MGLYLEDPTLFLEDAKNSTLALAEKVKIDNTNANKKSFFI